MDSCNTKILKIIMSLQKDGKITSDQKDDLKGKYKNNNNYIYNSKITKIIKRKNDE